MFNSLDGLTVTLVSPTSEVSDCADRHGKIGVAGPIEGLAVVQRFESSENVEITLHEIYELGHEGTTLETRHVQAPNGIESVLGSLDGFVDIFWGSLRNLGEGLASARVDDTVDKRR